MANGKKSLKEMIKDRNMYLCYDFDVLDKPEQSMPEKSKETIDRKTGRITATEAGEIPEGVI